MSEGNGVIQLTGEPKILNTHKYKCGNVVYLRGQRPMQLTVVGYLVHPHTGQELVELCWIDGEVDSLHSATLPEAILYDANDEDECLIDEEA